MPVTICSTHFPYISPLYLHIFLYLSLICHSSVTRLSLLSLLCHSSVIFLTSCLSFCLLNYLYACHHLFHSLSIHLPSVSPYLSLPFTRLSLLCHSSVTPLSLLCHSCHSSVTPLSLLCHSSVTPLSLVCHS